jgi:hypothetical protein
MIKWLIAFPQKHPILITFVIICCVLNVLNIFLPSPVTDNTHVWLYHRDSTHINLEQSQNHIQELTSFALQVQVYRENQKATKENLIFQIRGFFVIILSGLLTALFVTKKGPNIIEGIQWVGLILTVLIYGLEINLMDISQRIDKYINCDAKTVRSLCKTEPDSTHWYYINFDKDTVVDARSSSKTLSMIDSEETRPCTRRERKIEEALTPKLEHSCFYMFPLLIFVWGGWLRTSRRGSDAEI